MPIHRVKPDDLDEALKRLHRSGEQIVKRTFDERLGEHIIETEPRVETRA